MNNSRLFATDSLQDSTRDLSPSDVTISECEDKKETVNFSLVSGVFKSEDTSGCHPQLTRFHKSENDSHAFTTPSKRMKIAQSLTSTEPEKSKQTNDNIKYDCQEVNDTYDSQADGDTADNKKNDSSQKVGDTDGRQETEVSDDGHKDRCNKKDEADLFYGTHQTQVSEGGEADLHKHLVACKKNPGHTKFVPVNALNINHLPESHRDNDLVEFIKATADLTVRVDVKMTSSKRPEFWPNTTVPYPFYNMRESDVMRVATGIVWYAHKWTEKYNMGTCPCHKCKHSDTPSKVWGEVRIHTAAHVVFDDLEARHTTCRLFYDGHDSPLVTLDDWKLCEANIEEDWCELEYQTCDLDLLKKVRKIYSNWDDLWDEVNDRYKSSRDKEKLVFIVSHPHGCPKQVSLGHWIKRYVMDNYMSKYMYTTCTCPGSSWAYVHLLGYEWCYYHLHVHSGVNSKGNNFSGAGQYWL